MNDLIQQRLAEYRCSTAQQEVQAFKEMTQEIVLQALFDSGFFEAAAFQGGTALRLIHGLQRFSEDLDFSLIADNPTFDLQPHIDHVAKFMASYGYSLRITGRARVDSAVRHRFLKEDSIGNVVTFEHNRGFSGTVSIKVEVDTRPPAGATYEVKYIEFPIDFPVKVFDLPSLFASKSHALLCRNFVKGRDWFDFSWYAARRTPLNFALLSNAVAQLGPWQGQCFQLDMPWYVEQMRKRIETIDWQAAREDVRRFLRPQDQKSLELWSTDFFIDKLEKLTSA